MSALPRNVDRVAARRGPQRRGTTSVELAVVLPIFLVFVFGLIEVTRIYWVQSVLKTAAQDSCRFGSVCGVTVDEVEARVRECLLGTVDPDQVEILIKDAAVYDSGGTLPHEVGDSDAFATLPDFTTDYPLEDLEPGHLMLVRVRVPYEDITLLPVNTLSRMMALASGTPQSNVFAGQVYEAYSFSRHE